MCSCASGCGGPPESPSPSASGGSPAGPSGSAANTLVSERHFLSGYVTADGRVLRRDQGNDIVSEGQAYGMLVAEVVGDTGLARTIWNWTKQHLPGKDGLVASRATAGGRVQDTNSAADADILLAYALLRYDGPNRTALRADGRRLASRVLAAESITVGGEPVIVAGPWAKSPPRVDPSYWMPSVFGAIAHYTGDNRWRQAADSALRLLEQVTSGGTKLPPDWAQVSGGHLQPIASPSGGAPVQYGLDAARLPIWLGTGCSDRERSLAAAWWQLLSPGTRAQDLALSLSGPPISTAGHPLPMLAAAAAAAAAGDRSAAESLQVRAADFAGAHPTYYGSAWLALGGALLDGRLDPCQEDG